ncbi:MAG: right-handed parallel beta-helix repeat-containing protein [Opitutales bacterium]|nr:right-handed parallel beta-helix repeat-containing protein [Opitutales bacterium]
MRFISWMLERLDVFRIRIGLSYGFALAGVLLFLQVSAQNPTGSSWVWVEDDFESGSLASWSSFPDQADEDAPGIFDGVGVGGSKAMSVTVEAGDCFLSTPIPREASEGTYTFWFHPNGISIPSDSGWFMGNTFRVAGILGGDLWYAVAVLRMRQQDDVYKGFLEYRASDGTVVYDYAEGEFDVLNEWQKISIHYRIDASIAVLRNDQIVRELVVPGHAVGLPSVVVLGKSYQDNSISPQGQMLYDDACFLVPRIPDLYVDAQYGNDSAAGNSPSDALKTIQRAADKSGPGTTVHILPGLYQERLVVPFSGESDAWIQFVGEGSGDVVLDGTGIPIRYGDGLVQLSGRSYIRLRCLNIRNSTGSGINAYGSDHIEILDNTTFDTHSSGIKLRDCGNVMVSGNSVRRAVNGGTEECITISSCVEFEVCHNSVADGVGLYEGGEGICVKGNSLHGSVHHNAVHDLPENYDPAVHEAGEVGIYIGARNTGMTLSDVDVFCNTTSTPIGIAVSSEM